MNFEYDPLKSASNKIKHGIDFKEAQALWKQRTLERPANTVGEMRYTVTGLIGEARWTAVVTYRGAVIRIISVRRATGPESAEHEQRSNLRK